MNYSLYPTKYEIIDQDDHRLCASIKCNDESTSVVELIDKVHTAESFEELSVKIIQALKLMHPEGETK